jgi:hypothetical protein
VRRAITRRLTRWRNAVRPRAVSYRFTGSRDEVVRTLTDAGAVVVQGNYVRFRLPRRLFGPRYPVYCTGDIRSQRDAIVVSGEIGPEGLALPAAVSGAVGVFALLVIGLVALTRTVSGLWLAFVAFPLAAVVWVGNMEVTTRRWQRDTDAIDSLLRGAIE